MHLDTHIGELISSYGNWTYLLLFLIIFAETGLVVTPFLPGDSMIFVVGTFAASGELEVWILFFLLLGAAVIGDSVNYEIGRFLGAKVFSKDMRFLDQEKLMKTQRFYEKHGGKTIIIARFIPIIRTFAPFVAGVGSMKYRRFLAYNLVGALIWVGVALFAGYFFGNLPFVRDNFTLVVFAIMGTSFIPPVHAYIKKRWQGRSRRKVSANNESN